MKNQSSEIIFGLGLAGLGLSTAMFYESYLKRKAVREIKVVPASEYVDEYREVYKNDSQYRKSYLDTLQEHYELQIEELKQRREKEARETSQQEVYMRHYAKDLIERKLGSTDE